jgi:hypothetical protein
MTHSVSSISALKSLILYDKEIMFFIIGSRLSYQTQRENRIIKFIYRKMSSKKHFKQNKIQLHVKRRQKITKYA